MSKRYCEPSRMQRNRLSASEAEELFSKLDETGHVNEELARLQHENRTRGHAPVNIDPLADEDPSGSKVGDAITRAAVSFVTLFLAVVVTAQVGCGIIRRANTASLAEDVNLSTVASALRGGVEWGDGFTQFPQDFSVQEADENTGRIEVTVIDASSANVLECLSSSQIQATAFSINALLNPNINTVIYHVNAHVGDDGGFRTSQLFGFLKPTGDVSSIMTFVWTKTQSASGVNFNCSITGVDATLREGLRDQLTTSLTPVSILGLGGSGSDDSSTSGPTSVTVSMTGPTM